MKNLIFALVISMFSLTAAQALADIGIENNCGFIIVTFYGKGCDPDSFMILTHSLASYKTQKKDCQYVVSVPAAGKICTEVPYNGVVELKRRKDSNECDCITKWP